MSLKWEVTCYDMTTKRVKAYNIFRHREAYIKKLKSKCKDKDEFSEGLKRDLKWQYWSRTEYELILSLTDEGRVIVRPWCGSSDEEVDVTDRADFDWFSFASKYMGIKGHNNVVKIDIWDQLEFKFNEFVDYAWNYALNGEKDDD